MTIDEVSERYQIPIKILKEYESWGLCGEVKKIDGVLALRPDGYRTTELDYDTARCGIHKRGSGEIYASVAAWRRNFRRKNGNAPEEAKRNIG